MSFGFEAVVHVLPLLAARLPLPLRRWSHEDQVGLSLMRTFVRREDAEAHGARLQAARGGSGNHSWRGQSGAGPCQDV